MEGDVSTIGMLFLAEACEDWIAFDDLAEGLGITREDLANPARRYPWATFAELCRRFEELAGEEAVRAAGRRACRSELLAPYRRLLGMAMELGTAYRFAINWLLPALYRVPIISFSRQGSSRVEIVLTVPPEREGALAWFKMIGAGLGEFSVGFAEAPARVEETLTEREARYSITLPSRRAGLMPRLFGLFGADRAIEEIADHAASLERLREKAAAEAERSQRRLTRILGATTEMIVLLDERGTVTFAGPSIERMLGLEVREVEGRDFFALLTEQDRPAAAEAHRSLIRGGTQVRLEARALTAQGAECDLEIIAQNYLADETLRGILVTARDVTARRQAERRLREREAAFAQLVENLRGMAYRCRNDADWTMELVSDGALAITGYRADALRDNRLVSYRSLIHPDDVEAFTAKCANALASGRSCETEYRIVGPSGETRWVLDVSRGVYDEAGRVLGREGIIVDVTDRKQLEEQLSHAQRLESVGRLAGGIAHDFNNLLAVIMSYTELGMRGLGTSDPLRQDLEQVIGAAKRGSELTRQLLAFARRQPIEPRVLDLAPQLDQLLPLLRRATGDAIRLQCSVADSKLPNVLFDPGQFEQIVVNLVVNARDAMPGGGELALSLASVRIDPRKAASEGVQPGTFVRLRVRDSGHGMTPDVLERIFEPFFTTKPSGTGSGLGLATAYGLVRQAGGFLDVTSRPGEGARFDVYLPGVGEIAVPTPSEEITGPTFGTETVLLVEDNPELRHAAARILSTYGYHVLSAEDGASALALELGCMVPIHALVTDFVLPHLSGVQVAEQIRRRRPEMKVVYMSGSPLANVEIGSGEAFLQKPSEPQRLARTLRSLLDRPTKDHLTTAAPRARS